MCSSRPSAPESRIASASPSRADERSVSVWLTVCAACVCGWSSACRSSWNVVVASFTPWAIASKPAAETAPLFSVEPVSSRFVLYAEIAEQTPSAQVAVGEADAWEDSSEPPQAVAPRTRAAPSARKRRAFRTPVTVSHGAPRSVHPKRTMRPTAPKARVMARSLDPAGPHLVTHPSRDWKEARMADLIAIGYDDETTALEAEKEAEKLAADLIIQADAIAAIVRNKDGKYKVTTNHHAVGQGTVWGMWWGLLFGLLFFVPVFGVAIGAGFGALFGKLEKTGVDKAFQEQVRDMLKPGTSALFLVVEKVTPDRAVDALKQFGGTVLKTSLSEDTEAQLQAELSGSTQEPVGAGA